MSSLPICYSYHPLEVQAKMSAKWTFHFMLIISLKSNIESFWKHMNDQHEFCKAQSFFPIFSHSDSWNRDAFKNGEKLLLLFMDALSQPWKYHFLFFSPWGEITQILIWQMCLWNKTEWSQFMWMVSFWHTITIMKPRNLGFFLVETKN